MQPRRPAAPYIKVLCVGKRSAEKIKDYLLSPRDLGLPESQLLDLFDDERPGPQQVVELGHWITSQVTAARTRGTEILDLLLYYVGHGSFLGSSHDYYLLARRTERGFEIQTGILVTGLADCLKKRARDLRRFIILDCCFAGAAGRIFQGTQLDAAVRQTVSAMPKRGIVLLCSSSGERPSFVPRGDTLTMFSGALQRVLVYGDPNAAPLLTFQDVAEMTWQTMEHTHGDEAVRPFAMLPTNPKAISANCRRFEIRHGNP